MSDDDLRAAYAAGLRRPSDSTACPSPERLVALVERNGSEAERLALLDHVMACQSCREAFELIRALAAGRPPTRRVAAPIWLAAAVVVLAASVTVLWRQRAAPDALRGGAAPDGLVEPVGAWAGRPLRFVWHADSRASGYEIEIFDPSGDRLFDSTTADTVVTLPERALALGRAYHWWVTVRRADGTDARTLPATFTR